MSVEAIVQLVLAALRALPGVVEALTPDQRAEVASILEAARSRLPAAGSVTSATDAVIARHVAAATRPSEHLTQADVGTLRSLAASTSAALLSSHERARLLAVAAHLEPRIADTLPPPMPIPAVLDAPRGAWDEPGHEED